MFGTAVLLITFAGATASAATTTTTTIPSHHPVLAPMGNSYVFHLTYDGRLRDYRVHVPPAAIYGQPLPMVLNLHGATQSALLEEITSQMDPNADENGYLAVYPDGTPHLQGVDAGPGGEERAVRLERRPVLRLAGDQEDR